MARQLRKLVLCELCESSFCAGSYSGAHAGSIEDLTALGILRSRAQSVLAIAQTFDQLPQCIYGARDMIYYKWIESPVGRLLLLADERLAQSATAKHSLIGLHMADQKYCPEQTQHWQEAADLDLLVQTQQQLAEYFAHQRSAFDLPLNPQGTAFQKQVWQQLCNIPFGTTISYGTLAQRIGQSNASRAVGAANGRNPISIIVPCHRVIGGNGKLTGYAGGVDRKSWLLQHEQQKSAPVQQSLALFDLD